jgi:hypothetical protein
MQHDLSVFIENGDLMIRCDCYTHTNLTGLKFNSIRDS